MFVSVCTVWLFSSDNKVKDLAIECLGFYCDSIGSNNGKQKIHYSYRSETVQRIEFGNISLSLCWLYFAETVQYPDKY